MREYAPIAEEPAIRAARDLLLATAAFGANPESIGRFCAAVAVSPLSWPFVVTRSSAHRLLPLLDDAIGRLPSDEQRLVPERVRELLRLASMQREAAAKKQIRLLDKLLAEFRQRDLPLLILKGPAIAALYERPHLRPSDDLDLMVQEGTWSEVARLLDDLGCKPIDAGVVPKKLPARDLIHVVSSLCGRQLQYVAPCGTCLEIHFRVINYGSPAPIETAWERQRLESMAGLKIPTISREDTLLLQASHMNQHDFGRLIWFVDLARMLRCWNGRIEWGRIRRHCRRGPAGRALAYALELLVDLGLGVPGTPRPEQLAPPDWLTGRIHRSLWPKRDIMKLDITALSTWRFFWLLVGERPWPDGLRFAWTCLFPPQRYLGSQPRLEYYRQLLSHMPG